MAIRTEWKSEGKKLPDAAHLKAIDAIETKSLGEAFEAAKSDSRRRAKSVRPLVKASGLDSRTLDKQAKEADRKSRAASKKEAKTLARPTIDIKALERQALANEKKIGKKLRPEASWQGHIWSASSCGGWWSWNGESEEVPQYSCSLASDKVDVRTQAYGEGWFDGDYSVIHGYLGFQFSPPSYGHLHIHAYPWIHGFYSLYSNDEWWNSEYARGETDTWVDVHQNFWRNRQYVRRFTYAGQELHPTRSGRRDAQYSHTFYTSVGATDTVTVRVGIRLYSEARASGSRSILDFRSGAGNYFHVPWVYWYLHN